MCKVVFEKMIMIYFKLTKLPCLSASFAMMINSPRLEINLNHPIAIRSQPV
jgi:hypothetical protein